MRLLLAEWSRLWHRGSARLLLLVLLGFVALGGFDVWQASTPPTSAEIAEAQYWVEQARAGIEEMGGIEVMIAACLEQQANDRQAYPENAIDYHCAEAREPVLEDYLRPALSWEQNVSLWGRLGALLAGVAMAVVGALYVAGDFGAGVMTTWLTYVPQRAKVYWSKSAVVAVAGLVVGLVVNQLATWWPWAALRLHGSAPTVPTGFWAATWLPGTGYGLLIVVGAALAGSALGFLVRRGVVALALGVVYFLVDAFLRSGVVAAAPQRWLLSNTTSAFIVGESPYWISTCANDPQTGVYACEFVEKTITRSQAAPELAVILVVALAIGWASFRYRDVT